MKDTKVLFIVISVILAVVVIFTLVHNSKLKRDNDRVQAYFDQTLQALNEIQDSLSIIDTKDLVIHRIAIDPELADTSTTNPRERIMSSIQNINNYIAQNKERLTNLEQQLKEKQMNIKGLNRMISNLKKNIAEKEALIVDLTAQIGSLQETILRERESAAAEIAMKQETIESQQTTIGEQEKTIEEQTTTLSNQEKEINTIYYIAATKKELITKNFLTKGGIFSGSKKTSDYNEADMKEFNLLDKNEIRIDAPFKKVKILTEQPLSSYKVDDIGTYTRIKILKPTEFRKVKYLIIQTD